MICKHEFYHGNDLFTESLANSSSRIYEYLSYRLSLLQMCSKSAWIICFHHASTITYQRRGIQCISGHSWVQNITRCAFVVIFCVGRDNKFNKFQKLVMFWVCWWIEADSNSLIKLWKCVGEGFGFVPEWVPIFSWSQLFNLQFVDGWSGWVLQSTSSSSERTRMTGTGNPRRFICLKK